MTLTEQVKFYLGDSIADRGPRPDGINYSADEIAEFISQGVTLTGAVIVGFMQLSSEWASFALSSQETGLSFDAKETAKGYRDLALFYQNNPIPLIGNKPRTIPLAIQDAYSTPSI